MLFWYIFFIYGANSLNYNESFLNNIDTSKLIESPYFLHKMSGNELRLRLCIIRIGLYLLMLIFVSFSIIITTIELFIKNKCLLVNYMLLCLLIAVIFIVAVGLIMFVLIQFNGIKYIIIKTTNNKNFLICFYISIIKKLNFGLDDGKNNILTHVMIIMHLNILILLLMFIISCMMA